MWSFAQKDSYSSLSGSGCKGGQDDMKHCMKLFYILLCVPYFLLLELEIYLLKPAIFAKVFFYVIAGIIVVITDP